MVGGGLKENLQRAPDRPAQQVQEGGFIVIESGDWLFYGLVTDLQLGATDPRFADEQSETAPAARAGAPAARPDPVHQPGSAARADAGARPRTWSPDYPHWRRRSTLGYAQSRARCRSRPSLPTMPRCAWPVQGDIAEIFGEPEEPGQFRRRLHPRAGPSGVPEPGKIRPALSGIFGATGTGKSFLTRIILAGLIQYNRPRCWSLTCTTNTARRHRLGYRPARDRAANQVPQPGAGGWAGQGALIRATTAGFQPGDRHDATSSRRISNC